MTAFGPQLIGETEKTLNAILRRLLGDTGLTEQQWVTLRIAGQNDGREDLATLVAERAHFADSTALVAALAERRLLDGSTLSPAGHDLVETIRRRTAAATAPIWEGLEQADVAATERVLTTVVTRAREVLSAGR